MAKRMLGLFLALCLIVGMLPVIALAEDTTETEEPVAKTATLTINTGDNSARVYWTPTMAEGMDPIYRLTTEDGTIATGATADYYNLKVEWPTGGMPTLTMNSATIKNDNVNPSMQNSIRIGGTADWEIVLVGKNTIYGNHNSKSTTTASYRLPKGIYAANSGTLTIRSESKDAGSLLIDNYGGHCIQKNYNALHIENATVDLKMHQTGSNAQYGILLQYESVGNEDKTNLQVLNSNLTIYAAAYHGNFAILLTDTDDHSGASYVNSNTGDILFQNSIITLTRPGGDGSVQTGSALVQFGTGSNFTIDRCETTIQARHKCFNYAPEILNHTAATVRVNDDGQISDFAYEPNAPVNNDAVSLLSVTHTCLAGEPVYETVKGNQCTSTKDLVTHCVVCDKEMSRQTEETIVTHTPGKKEELKDQRVDASITLGKSNTDGSGWSVNSGKYVFKNTCAICGETWTTEETFQPAILDYLPLSAEGTTTRAYDYGTQWADNSKKHYAPRMVITAGQTYYFTTEGGHETFTENRYMKPLTDETKIAAGEWNVKFEYPLYGTPVMTLKNAEIINGFGLWYGIYIYKDLAPLTVIVDGTNVIAHSGTSYTKGGHLSFRTTNPVTIIGKNNAKLDLDGRCITSPIRAIGDLSIQNVTIDIFRHDISAITTTASPAVIESEQGNVTISDCDIDINATAPKGQTGAKYGIRAKKTLTVTNCDIFALVNTSATGCGILHGADVVINECDLELAFAYLYHATATGNRYGDAINYTNSIQFNYTNGFVAYSKDDRTIYYPDGHPTTGLQWAAPSSPTKYTSVSSLTKARLNYYYFKINPNANPATPTSNDLLKFDGTAVTVENDLTLEFALDATNIPAGSIAYITRTKGDTVDAREIALTDEILEDGFYVIPYTGIAAKEMHDEITIVVKNADGKQITEVKTDSIYDYIVRMLRGEKDPNMSETKYAALKTILVDMLNYGTMAQIRFDYNTGTLANAVLNPTEWGYATTMQETPAVKAEVQQEENVTTSTHLGTAYELKSNISMLMAVDTTDMGKGSYAMVYVGDSTEGVRVEAEDYDDFAVFTFTGMVAADGRKNITFKFYTADGELKLTVTDSLAAYVGRNVEKYPYLANLMKYCDSAAAYFAIANQQN